MTPRAHRVVVGESGVSIRVLDWGGDGPLALLHHANGFCAATWALVAERIAPQFRVLAIDARGHGESSRPEGDAAYHWSELARDWLAVTHFALDLCGRSEVDLVVGNSLGGAVALLAAAERPTWYRRLVLLDPVTAPSRAGPSDARAAIEPPPLTIAEQARKRRQIWPSRAAAAAAWRDKPTFAGWQPRAFELYLEHGLRDRDDGEVELSCPGAVEAAIFANTGCVDVLAAAEAVRVPTWVVRAGRGYFPVAMFEALCQRLPVSQFLELDAGHLVPMEAPELTAELLLTLP